MPPRTFGEWIVTEGRNEGKHGGARRVASPSGERLFKGRQDDGAANVYTPTGKGLVWDSALRATPENRPCSKDISPVYQ